MHVSEHEQGLAYKKEQVELKLQQRNQTRESLAEAARTAKSSAGQESTEDLVIQFYLSMEPMVGEIKEMLSKAKTLSGSEVNPHLDKIVVKLQKLQELVTDAGLFLPPYDVKKSQNTLSSLHTQFQETQQEVKPKKKFGFKSSKHKNVKPTVAAPDISSLSVVDSSSGYSNTNSCSVSNLTDQTVILTREQVEARDVSLDNLTNCRVEIKGPPSTLHMSTLANCTILCGPVATSVFVDICSSSTLGISCQQMRIHRTTSTDIYLHTTAKAILEDSTEVRVAPYSWSYQGIDQDFVSTCLDRELNNWDKIGDFNWLALDKPSPNWSVLPEESRVECL
jgi:hypothetical protein